MHIKPLFFSSLIFFILQSSSCIGQINVMGSNQRGTTMGSNHFEPLEIKSPSAKTSTTPKKYYSKQIGVTEAVRQQNMRIIHQASGSAPIVPPSDPQQASAFMKMQMAEYQARQEMRQIKSGNNQINKTIVNKSRVKDYEKSYYDAFNKLNKMQGDYSSKEAVFTVENAYFDNKYKQLAFDNVIKEIGSFLRTKMNDFNYDTNSNLDKNLMLFRFFSDTLKKGSFTHVPYRYDFEDIFGEEDWTKMFVMKLLLSNSGQCHSMPQLYLILAEEIKAKAHLVYSPNHTYVKFKDDEGKWVSLELTNNSVSTDAFVKGSGYIKSEALQQGIYMQPIDDNGLLSQQFTDLGLGYKSKYGNSNFVYLCAKRAIDLNPKNISAQLLLENHLTEKFNHAEKYLKQKGVDFRQTNEAHRLANQILKQQKIVDGLGYEPMPKGAYEDWLKSISEEKKKQKNQKPTIIINTEAGK